MSILKPRTTTVVIYQGDDLERLGELHRAAEVAGRQYEAARQRIEAMSRAALRQGDDIPNANEERERRDDAQAAYDQFVDEAAERAVEVELTAIGRRRWRDLLGEHAPRVEKVDGKEQTVEADALHEVNTETFPMALLTYARDGVKTVTEPDVSGPDLKAFLEDEASEGDFERLWETAYWLNRAPGEDPPPGKILDSHGDVARELDLVAAHGWTLGQWEALPDSERAWWLARDTRERELHDCGHPREVCADPERLWYPQLSVCHVRQEQAANQWRYGELREKYGEYHDGTRKSWAKERSLEHPYHYMDGATVWVADTNLGLGGDFLSGTPREAEGEHAQTHDTEQPADE